MKSRINKILNASLYLVFCTLLGIGLILEFKLPPGSQGGRGLTVLNLDRHAWGEWHLWAGWLFLILVVLHMAMHGKWLLQVASKKSGWLLALGLGCGAAIIGTLLILPTNAPRHGLQNNDCEFQRIGCQKNCAQKTTSDSAIDRY